MRIVMGPEFRQQWERYQFRFCCEDCSFLDRQNQCCVHGWPREEHQEEHYRDPSCQELIFCKEFELDF